MADDPAQTPGGGTMGTDGGDDGDAQLTQDAPADALGDAPGRSDALDAPDGGAAPRRVPRWLVEWAVIIACVVALTFVLRAFVIQTYEIPSGSMIPTLQIGDRIVVNKLSYDFHGVHRGDVIVFQTPPAEHGRCAGPPVPDLVKRVVGLPGETISSRGNTVLVDGRPLSQPWFKAVPLGEAITPQKIPANHYFVMGDNRPNSCDSRTWGTIPKSSIVGRAFAVVWPLSQVKGL